MRGPSLSLIVLSLLATTVFRGGAHAAIAVDDTSSATDNVQTLVWSHTVGAGANRHMIVSVSIRNAANIVDYITYGADSLSFIGARNNDDNAVRVEMWYLTAPDTGTANVSVTLTGEAKQAAGAISFTGVHQSSPHGTFVSNYSTGTGSDTASVDVTSAAGELIVDALSCEGDSYPTAPGPGQTQQWVRYYNPAGGDVTGGASTEPGAASVTMSWTMGSGVKWAIAAVQLKPAAMPDVTMLKSAQTISDPVNGGSNPKAIPAAIVLYTITTANEDEGVTDNDSVVVTDPVPSNTDLFVSDIDTLGSGPVLFEQGATPSGLTYAFISLNSLLDDVDFSDDGGSTWTYVPTPDPDGYDSAVTDLRVKPKGVFAGSDGSNHPSYSLKFKMRIE